MDTVIRELLPQQQPRTIERRDLQYITISKEELTSSDSLSPDPWKRDAREKAEKQQQLHIVDLLDKEIQELQVGTPSYPFWGMFMSVKDFACLIKGATSSEVLSTFFFVGKA